jgi:2-oxoglutarate dehydrogenase E2 component (dihydrolipoamide succinyltransferase)
MGKDIIVPKMGESITDAHVGQIFKGSGSVVAVDDEILELETDKVNQVLYAPQAGTVTLNVKTGDLVKIEQVIGQVSEGGGEAAAPAPEAKAEEHPPQPEIKEEKAPEASPPPPPKDEGSARQLKEDYFSPPPAPSKPAMQMEGASKRTKMSRIRQTIASRLVEAKSQTAMLTTFNEIDMSEVIEIRNKYKEEFQNKFGVKLGFLSFFVRAAISALEEFPYLNSTIEGDEIVEKEGVDMGIAVSTDKGLVVPVLRRADKMSFDQIEKGIETFSKKAREGGLQVDDIRGGSFTITNGGTFGSLLSTPILNFPQSGILGLHKIMKRAVVVDDQIVIRSMMYVALTYDHRIVDGKEAVQFLVHIKNLLEDPHRFVIGV